MTSLVPEDDGTVTVLVGGTGGAAGRNVFVADIAIHQANAGEFDMVLKTAELLKESPSGPCVCLEFHCRGSACAGTFQPALASVAAIHKDKPAARISDPLHLKPSRTHRFDPAISGAIETAKLKSRLDLRVNRLTNIAVTRHLAGKDDSREFLDLAVAAVKDSNEKEGPVIGSAQAYIAQSPGGANGSTPRGVPARKQASRVLEAEAAIRHRG